MISSQVAYTLFERIAGSLDNLVQCVEPRSFSKMEPRKLFKLCLQLSNFLTLRKLESDNTLLESLTAVLWSILRKRVQCSDEGLAAQVTIHEEDVVFIMGYAYSHTTPVVRGNVVGCLTSIVEGSKDFNGKSKWEIHI